MARILIGIFFIMLLVILAISLSLFSVKTKISPPPSSKTQLPQPTSETPLSQTIASNLDVPWGLAFLPDGQILFTQRSGEVLLIDKNGSLAEKPIAEISEVKEIGEGGLLGIAIHPQFSSNQYIYLYYTYSGNGFRTSNRVVRFRFDGKTLLDKLVVVDQIPGALFHNGGRLKFGPDNYLYITTGDAQQPSQSQDKSSLAGKILRVTDDGKPAADNPFKTQVYSFGHRNPQGLAWDETGKLWATEHGSENKDEVNLILPGKNYGWPTIQGDQSQTNMEKAIIQSGEDTWAPSGAAFIKGSLFFGGLRGQALFEFDTKTNSIKKHFFGEFGRIRDVVLGPDNHLYITTSNRDGRGKPKTDDDKIIRVNPQKL